MFEKNHDAHGRKSADAVLRLIQRGNRKREMAKCGQVMETEMKTDAMKGISGIYSRIVLFIE